jgi:hypothetical protein
MRRLLLALVVVAAAIAAPAAGASVIIDRSASNWTPVSVHLSVNDKGEAMVSYTEDGQQRHVLAWGAVNAVEPTAGGSQVTFQLAYDGGYQKYYTHNPTVQAALKNLRDLQDQMSKATAAGNNPARYALKPKIADAYATLAKLRNAATNYWQTGGFSCGAYNGPTLAWFVEACKAPDGSYWALQSWQRALPDYGVKSTATEALWELHLSHWTGALPVLSIDTDWSYAGKWNHLFGTFVYDGTGVFGFKATSLGVPLDTFGRNVYVDTYDSTYGPGWQRENSFLTHTGTGSFCYSVNPHGSHPAGTGTMYRATIQGPGVVPDIMWQGNAPAAYSSATQAQMDQQILALHDPKCQPTDH